MVFKNKVFSIVVPVYNVEKYAIESLESLRNQSFLDFEVIIVNDGSTDNSLAVIEEYLRKIKDSRFNLYSKVNGGLSSARNFGFQNISGDYVLFVDSDDYVDRELLSLLYEEIQSNFDLEVVRFPKKKVDEIGHCIEKDSVKEFHYLKGDEAFYRLRRNRVTLETACTYCFSTKYWRSNEFRFSEGRLHEDLGLIPRVIYCSNCVSSLSLDSFYNYRCRKNSIMTTVQREILIKKVDDVIYFCGETCKFVCNQRDGKYLQCYVKFFQLSLLRKIWTLDYEDKKNYEKIYYDVLRQYKISGLKDLMKYIYYKIRFNH